jgi:fructose-bisphosphate aldolase class II
MLIKQKNVTEVQIVIRTVNTVCTAQRDSGGIEMPLVTNKELLEAAEEGNYAVGAFNAINMETAQAIFGAAEDEKSPLILQITQTTTHYTEPEELVALVFALVDKSTVPVSVHLDHGRTFDVVMQFLRLGFTSVMIDGSLQPDGKTPRTYEENIEITKKVVEAAHALGVSVEGELGRLGQIGTEIEVGDPGRALTDPEQAKEFVEKTGIDALAVAIGTTHGLFQGVPTIVHDRLEQINKTVDIPLVMHGGTGVPDDAVKKAIQLGIRKVNIDTQMRVAWYNATKEVIEKTDKEHAEADRTGQVRKYDIRKLLAPARDAVRETVRGRMRVFGSSGKA